MENDYQSNTVLDNYSFTNPFRADDRVSIYLINGVHLSGSQEPEDVFLRTLIFKLFNEHIVGVLCGLCG